MGNRVRDLRKGAGLTQVQLSKALGIDQSTLSDIERGQNDSFSGKVLLKMAEAFGRSPYFIVHGKDSDVPALTPEEAELVLAYRHAGRDQRSALLTMARALAPPPPTPAGD